MEVCGVAGHGLAGLARRCLAGRGRPRPGAAWFGVAGEVVQGRAWCCPARFGVARQAVQGPAGQGMAGKDRAARLC